MHGDLLQSLAATFNEYVCQREIAHSKNVFSLYKTCLIIGVCMCVYMLKIYNHHVSEHKSKSVKKEEKQNIKELALTHSLAHTSFLLLQKTNESVDLVLKAGEKCNHQLNAC